MYEVKMFFDDESKMNKEQFSEAICIVYKRVNIKGDKNKMKPFCPYVICHLDALKQSEQDFILKIYKEKLLHNYTSGKNPLDIINSKYRESSEEYDVKMFFNSEDRMNRNKCEEAFCILYKDVCIKGNECFINRMSNYSVCSLDCLDKDEQEFILKEYNNKIRKNKSPYLQSIMDIINSKYRESNKEYDADYVVVYFPNKEFIKIENGYVNMDSATKIIYNGIVLKDVYNIHNPFKFYNSNDNPVGNIRLVYSMKNPYIDSNKIKAMHKNILGVPKGVEIELDKLRAANKILKTKLAYAEEIIAKCMKG